MKEIVLAGGCFWGVQKGLQLLNGIVSTDCGYANGDIENPTYGRVCAGDTNFKEAVYVKYDENKLTLETLLEAFFMMIDPTLINRQGNDIGTQYQAGIYYMNDECGKQLKTLLIPYRNKFSTFNVEVEPLKNFYRAENEHQSYLKFHPYGYCHIQLDVYDAIKKLND